MNNERRKQLRKAIELLTEAQSIIESVHDDERDALENLPESIQYGERGDQMQDCIDALEYIAWHEINDIVDSLNEVIGE